MPGTACAGQKMNKVNQLKLLALGAVIAPAVAHAQVPDLVTALDAGGRAMGMGGATNATGSDTQSAYYNPAGLGYLNRKQIGATVRNLPKSQSLVSGDLRTGRTLTTEGMAGPKALSHLGVALPLKGRNGSSNGTVSVAYTTGGVIRDERNGTSGLTEGGVATPFYYELLENRTDFLSIAYGKTSKDYSFNWGAALLYAMNHQSDFTTNTTEGTQSYDEKANGWGGLFGIQFVPKGMPNLSFGASYRTAINLKGDNLLYSKIPARLEGGVAWRKDGLRHGQDFLVAGVEVQHFFEGNPSPLFDRRPQTMLGFGVEYDYNDSSFRVPLRVGYNYLPSSSFEYGSRNTLTFGIGYRPSNTDWGVDLNFAKPQHGSLDFALSILYRFGR